MKSHILEKNAILSGGWTVWGWPVPRTCRRRFGCIVRWYVGVQHEYWWWRRHSFVFQSAKSPSHVRDLPISCRQWKQSREHGTSGVGRGDWTGLPVLLLYRGFEAAQTNSVRTSSVWSLCWTVDPEERVWTIPLSSQWRRLLRHDDTNGLCSLFSRTLQAALQLCPSSSVIRVYCDKTNEDRITWFSL